MKHHVKLPVILLDIIYIIVQPFKLCRQREIKGYKVTKYLGKLKIHAYN